MALVHETEVAGDPAGSYVEWGAVTAGAVASLALSFVLLTFGAAAGLSAVSPWTTSATGATAVAVGSAFWILLVALWSCALGGYLAARLRHRWRGASETEVEFRDKAHGLLSWALAIVLAAVVATLASASGRSAAGGTVNSIAASNTAVDTIVRTPKIEIAPATEAQRAEVGRLLAANLAAGSLATADKQYLVGLVSARTGLNAADADRTVTDAFTKFKDQVDRARKAGVVMAFIAAASMMVGAAVAWWAAGLGGEHREQGTIWEAFRGRRNTVVVRKVP